MSTRRDEISVHASGLKDREDLDCRTAGGMMFQEGSSRMMLCAKTSRALWESLSVGHWHCCL